MSDPYAEFGGQQVQQGGDPYAEFGGKASPAVSATPTGTISNAPSGPLAWLKNLEGDVRYGTGTTLPGRVLQKMGATGVGDSSAADTVASPLLGPIRTAQGVAEVKSKPLQGAKDIVGGVLQTATLPGGFMAPEVAEGAVGKIPNKKYAEFLLNSVEDQAGKLPVKIANAQEGLINLINWQGKTQLGPTVNKFLNRVTKSPDLTYEEARDFYQLLGKLSADESSKLAPAVRADLTKMVVGLKQDIGNTADQVGKAEQYYAGLREYAMASRMKAVRENIMKWVVKPAIGTAAATAGGAAGYGAYKALTK